MNYRGFLLAAFLCTATWSQGPSELQAKIDALPFSAPKRIVLQKLGRPDAILTTSREHSAFVEAEGSGPMFKEGKETLVYRTTEKTYYITLDRRTSTMEGLVTTPTKAKMTQIQQTMQTTQSDFPWAQVPGLNKGFKMENGKTQVTYSLNGKPIEHLSNLEAQIQGLTKKSEVIARLGRPKATLRAGGSTPGPLSELQKYCDTLSQGTAKEYLIYEVPAHPEILSVVYIGKTVWHLTAGRPPGY